MVGGGKGSSSGDVLATIEAEHDCWLQFTDSAAPSSASSSAMYPSSSMAATCQVITDLQLRNRPFCDANNHRHAPPSCMHVLVILMRGRGGEYGWHDRLRSCALVPCMRTVHSGLVQRDAVSTVSYVTCDTVLKVLVNATADTGQHTPAAQSVELQSITLNGQQSGRLCSLAVQQSACSTA